eukprot:NODE_1209_length_1210_cov_312.954978.p1 GENE.NODE_1209_length_1210_cov_312.954978~~NODE_1209_length_1210_cov_312.954978.p1  ORF type:complete len:284 (-),score=80.73 NODE_1209_length_1210_cov_312.954978:223-1074(-)
MGQAADTAPCEIDEIDVNPHAYTDAIRRSYNVNADREELEAAATIQFRATADTSVAQAHELAGRCKFCFVHTLSLLTKEDDPLADLLAASSQGPLEPPPPEPSGGRQVLKFCVCLNHTAGLSIGMDLDFLDGDSLNVCKVKRGAVLDWNRTALGEFRVRKGDRIDEVNGYSGDAQTLINLIEAGGHLELWVTRPVPVNIQVTRAEGVPLGLELDCVANGTSLRIREIDEGPVLEWNKRHRMEAIEPRDRIVAVNAIEGLSTQLMSEIRQAERLKLACLCYGAL